MSTRAMYTFRNADGSEEFHVYKHHDGYPTGAAEALVSALEHAWPLPRYEADEFAAAFVAANKSHYVNRELELLRELDGISGANFGEREKLRKELDRCREYAKNYNGGDVRLCASGPFEEIAPSDLEYRYIVQPKKGGHDLNSQVLVTAYQVDCDHHGDERVWSQVKLFVSPLKSGDTLKAKAAAWEGKRAA
jgi:hypothetical protein